MPTGTGSGGCSTVRTARPGSLKAGRRASAPASRGTARQPTDDTLRLTLNLNWPVSVALNMFKRLFCLDGSRFTRAGRDRRCAARSLFRRLRPLLRPAVAGAPVRSNVGRRRGELYVDPRRAHLSQQVGPRLLPQPPEMAPVLRLHAGHGSHEENLHYTRQNNSWREPEPTLPEAVRRCLSPLIAGGHEALRSVEETIWARSWRTDDRLAADRKAGTGPEMVAIDSAGGEYIRILRDTHHGQSFPEPPDPLVTGMGRTPRQTAVETRRVRNSG